MACKSMGGMGAMMLAQRFPDMYRGVAVFRGCYSTMDPLGRTAVQATISSRSGDPTNICGVPGGPEWEAHDPLINAAQLRGSSDERRVGTECVIRVDLGWPRILTQKTVYYTITNTTSHH